MNRTRAEFVLAATDIIAGDFPDPQIVAISVL